MAEVKKLTHKHDAIMSWLILNPEKSQRECADYFNVTQAWLSSLVNSDIFRSAMRARTDEVHVRIADSIPAKLSNLAHLGTSKLEEKLEKSEDPEFILSATDKILHRMGYGPQGARAGSALPLGAAPQQQNNFFISSGDLAEARLLIKQGQNQLPALELPAGDVVEVPNAD